MNRPEALRRQNMGRMQRSSRGGIPGWLWGVLAGAIGALAAVGLVVRQRPGSGVVAEQPPSTQASPSPEPTAPTEITQLAEPTEQAAVPLAPRQSESADVEEVRREEELDALRSEVNELRQRSDNVPPITQQMQPPPQEPDQLQARAGSREEEAKIDAEWRPAFSDFQKRFAEKKAEFDTMLGTLKQIQAQCNYTHMGEPTEAEKRKGVRQEGLPASLVMGGTVGYGSSCDTVDKDIKKAEQDQFEALRQIQAECYKEAIARGVSTAKAKLR